MALSDPTGGTGYPFGSKLSSTHMTTIATQQPKALDGVDGGAYSLTQNLTVALATSKLFGFYPDSGATSTALYLNTDGVFIEAPNVVLGDGSAQTVTVDDATTFQFAGTNTPKLVARSYVYHQPLAPVYATSNIEFDPTLLLWKNNDTAFSTSVFPLTNLPTRGQITSITAQVTGQISGGAGHGGSLPATMPTIALSKQAAAITSIGTQIDTTASAATYDTLHTITLSGLTEDVDGDGAYYLSFIGEGGANAVANSMGLQSLVVVCSCTEIAP